MAQGKPTPCWDARWPGCRRDEFSLVGAIGHDFYTGEREGSKGFPRFTDPRLRGPAEYVDYVRMATERSLQRCGVDAFDVLLLHNPDRTGYTSEAVWDALEGLRAEGLTRSLGVAPGPANGFTLDVIDCLERFGDRIDWAMVILNPLEPWPGELVLPAAERHDVRVITRVVDYGGLFHDDVLEGHAFPRYDHRGFRPDGWVERGREKLGAMRAIADRHGLTLLQLACHWNLAHGPVHVVAPTLIEEPGSSKSIEDKLAELAAVSVPSVLSDGGGRGDPRARRQHGVDGLKGAAPDYEGEPIADRWPLDDELVSARVALGHLARARPAQSRVSQRRADRLAGVTFVSQERTFVTSRGAGGACRAAARGVKLKGSLRQVSGFTPVPQPLRPPSRYEGGPPVAGTPAPAGHRLPVSRPRPGGSSAPTRNEPATRRGRA